MRERKERERERIEQERDGKREARRETKERVNSCKNGRGRAATFSPAGSDRPVIYRPEPSPSLTPLLRNYTQSVANKSKKVSAALVPIHKTERSHLASSPRSFASPRRFRPVLARDPALGVLPPSPRRLYARSVRTSAVNSIEILVQIARPPSPLRASKPREIRVPRVIDRTSGGSTLVDALFARLCARYLVKNLVGICLGEL